MFTELCRHIQSAHCADWCHVFVYDYETMQLVDFLV